MNQKLIQLSGIGLTLLLFCFILAYVFARVLYRPLGSILRNLLKDSRYKGTKTDEYGIVSDAISGLIAENSSIRQSVDQQKLVVRDCLIREIFNGDMENEASFSARLHDNGIALAGSHYSVLLVTEASESGEESDGDSRLFIYGHIQNILETYCAAPGVILDNCFAFLINFDKAWLACYTDKLTGICSEISAKLPESLRVSLRFFAGPPCTSLKSISVIYLNLRNYLSSRIYSENDQICFIGESKSKRLPDYPIAIQKALLFAIKSADVDGVRRAMDEFFISYVKSGFYTFEKVKNVLLILLGCIMGDLAEDNYDIKLTEAVNLSEINGCRDWNELNSLIESFSQSMIDYLRGKNEQILGSLYAHKAMDYINENYAKNLSVSDIAEQLNISTSYLNRVFKSKTGKSPLEYINGYRIKRSKELLMDKNYTLGEISAMIGYNDVHSFIKFFKKYESLTPGEYRKVNL
jgi:two-component system, response regulator YesN